MALNLAAFDKVLKLQYLPGIKDQLNWKTVALSRFQRRGKDDPNIQFVGKQAVMALGTGGNEGIGNRADGGTLPAAGNQLYDQATWDMRYSYARIQVTGPTIKAARNNAGAYIRAVDSEIKGAVRNLKADSNRQLLGPGNGILSMCGTTTASTTVVVTSTKNIRKNMIVDIIVASSGATGTGGVSRTVTSVPSATTFVISGAAITTDVTFAVYREGNRILETFGLVNLNEANPTQGAPVFGGLNRSTAGNEYWKGNRLNNTGTARSISNSLMQTAQDTAAINGEGEISLILTNQATMRAWGDYLFAKKQFFNSQTLKGGYDFIPFNNIPVVADKDLNTDPANSFFPAARRLYFLDESTMGLIEMSDWDWMDEDGAILSRVSGQDAYEAVLFKYWNFYCERPAASCILDDITEG